MGASISTCERYRYQLDRRWDPTADCLGYIMLNPSTADSTVDDPTIRRCIGFAKREGYGGICVTNLYAWRATDPRQLLAAEDPFGPQNLGWLEDLFRHHQTVVAAWGPKYGETLRRRRTLADREARTAYNPDDTVSVRLMAGRHGSGLVCLGTSKDGSPRHPLMVRADQPFTPWPVEPAT